MVRQKESLALNSSNILRIIDEELPEEKESKYVPGPVGAVSCSRCSSENRKGPLDLAVFRLHSWWFYTQTVTIEVFISEPPPRRLPK